MEYEHGAASWFTVNVLPATVSVVCRAAPVLAATSYLTSPSPTSTSPSVIVTHGALLTAVQAHPDCVSTSIPRSVAPSWSVVLDVGLIE
jgi:hypothetical protein